MKKLLSFLIVIISLFMFISVRALDDENPIDPVVDPVVDPDPQPDPIPDPISEPEPEPILEPEPEPEPILEPEPAPQPKVIQQPKEEERVEITTTGIEEEQTGLLVRIDSKIVKIVLKDNVYEYNVSIDSNVEKLDLEPIKKNDNTTVEISTQVIKELEDNKITITLKNGDTTETYIINVRVRPEIKEVVKIENTNYKEKYLAFILFFGIIIIACVFLMKKEK